MPIQARPDWTAEVERLGFLWHTDGAGAPYWNESAYYEFTQSQIADIEEASRALHQLFVEAGQYVIDHELYARFAIPEWARPLIARAWDEEPPALNHGRFDLGYDGRFPPKLFEYNCDTPTALFEAAIVQWRWLEAVRPGERQCNDLHEWLVWKWGDLAPALAGRRLYFTHVDDRGEDTLTTTYLRDTALAAGVQSEAILIDDIGWDAGRGRFVDLEARPIDALFHLYPWEWLAGEAFAPHIAASYDATLWIEPIWKMIWSNKAILPILWELFPGHPNLLPAFETPRGEAYVKKPILAREGANISLVRGGIEAARTGGDYGAEGYIYQALFDLPDFDGQRPVIGAWMVDGHPAGIGVREGGLITGNTARFTPHVVVG